MELLLTDFHAEELIFVGQISTDESDFIARNRCLCKGLLQGSGAYVECSNMLNAMKRESINCNPEIMAGLTLFYLLSIWTTTPVHMPYF